MKVLQYTWSSHHNRSLRQRCIQWASTNTKTQDEALTRGNNKVGILILLRHGQSQWNVTDAALGTTARFTGWTDIPLTFRGVQQAVAAGHSINTFFQRTQPESHLQTKHVPLDAAFCSLLSRSRDTLTLCLQQLDLVVGYPPSDTILAPTASSTVLPSFKSMVTPPLDKKNMDSSIRYKIPIVSSWRLNERHYGALVGLSKEGAERLYGQTQLKKWRDGWDIAPPPMEQRQHNKWKGLVHTQAVTVVRDPGIGFGEEEEAIDLTTSTIRPDIERKRLDLPSLSPHSNPKLENMIMDSPSSQREFTVYEYRTSKQLSQPTSMPTTESLSDTCKRILPLWTHAIAPRLREGQTILLVAHANTIRCLLYHMDPLVVSQETMKQVKIPSAVPLVYTFRSSPISDHQVEGQSPDDEHEDIYTEIPGNLWLIRRPKNKNIEKEEKEDIIDLGKHLNGIWLHSQELKSLSFCSKLGIKNLEHEIA